MQPMGESIKAKAHGEIEPPRHQVSRVNRAWQMPMEGFLPDRPRRASPHRPAG
jgi:hypothetical protein